MKDNETFINTYVIMRTTRLLVFQNLEDRFAEDPASRAETIVGLLPSCCIVNRAYAVALSNGGADEGEPGLRSQDHLDYYCAYFRDPDGNKLRVRCHDPEVT